MYANVCGSISGKGDEHGRLLEYHDFQEGGGGGEPLYQCLTAHILGCLKCFSGILVY